MESETGRRMIERLRELRALTGLTQEKLAEKAGLRYKHYQAVEAGRKPDVRLSTVERVAKAFGIETWELLHPTIAEQMVAEQQAKYERTPGRKPRRK